MKGRPVSSRMSRRGSAGGADPRVPNVPAESSSRPCGRGVATTSAARSTMDSNSKLPDSAILASCTNPKLHGHSVTDRSLTDRRCHSPATGAQQEQKMKRPAKNEGVSEITRLTVDLYNYIRRYRSMV